MGFFRMYTNSEGKSMMEELNQDDPILETVKTCTGCSVQINEPSEFSELHPAPRRRWMTMLKGQIDIQLADGTIHSFGPEDCFPLQPLLASSPPTGETFNNQI